MPAPDAMLPPVSGIYRLGLDGAGQEQVVGPGSSEPAWSAQGTLAFVRDGDLITLRPGQEELRLTSRGATQPAWSPHGTQIAFTHCDAPPSCDVYVVPRSGGKARRVVRDASNPAWSPDGRFIAFLRDTTPKGSKGGDPWPAPSLFRLDAPARWDG
jgi:Tol biopolymer transport system component